MILDNVQWLDSETASLVSRLHKLLNSQPLVILLTYDTCRSSGAALNCLLEDISGRANTDIVELQPLTTDEIQDLLSSASEGRLPASHRDMITGLCGGNPFIALEMKRAVEDGQEEPLRSLNYVTSRLGASLSARIESLTEPQARLIEAASVLDRLADLHLVGQVAGLSMEECLLAARSLTKCSILKRDTDKCSYQHGVMREYVYERLGDLRRAALHFCAGEVLSRHKGAADALVVAEHYQKSGNRRRTYEIAIAGCEEALDRSDNEKAVRLAAMAVSAASSRVEKHNALSLAAQANESLGRCEALCSVLKEMLHTGKAATLEDRLDLQLTLASAQIECSDWSAARGTLRKSESVLQRIPDGVLAEKHLIKILSLSLKLSTLMEEKEAALETSERLRALVLRSKDEESIGRDSIVRAAYTLALHELFVRSVDSAEAVLNSVADEAEVCSVRSRLALLLARSMIHVRQANWDAARSVLSRGLAKAVRSRDHLFQAHFSNNLACLALEEGDWNEVERHCLACMELDASLSTGNHLALPPLLNLATGYFYQSRLAEAEERLEIAVSMCSQDAASPAAVEVHSTLGLIALQLGRWSDAESLWKRVDGLMQTGRTGLQERFKLQWFRTSVELLLFGNPSAISELWDAAWDERPRDVVGHLKLLWLHECLVEIAQASGSSVSADSVKVRELRKQLRAAGLGWFIRCSSRWYRDTTSHTRH
jgi:tetratricopeptide (TPR) repeat protein